MTVEKLTIWAHRHVAMKSKSRRTSSYSQRNAGKTDSIKTKVHFAKSLLTIHEVPYNFDIDNRANYGLRLPKIEAHKYAPLAFRDPYAKPSKRNKAGKIADMFVSDAVNFPFIKRKTTYNDANKVDSKTSNETMELPSEPRLPKASTGTSEKLQDGNTLHFKYSDFILRKMDRSATSKDKRFIVK